MSGRPLSRQSATRVIARWSLVRMLRGRMIWVSLGFAALPLLPVVFGVAEADDWNDFVESVIGVLAILGPLYTSSAIAEEIEGKTFAYLWSRPIPRSSVLLGKLAAGIPLTGLSLAAVLLLGGALLGVGGGAIARAMAGALVGAIAVGTTAATLGCLIPRYALATSIGVLLVIDGPIGAMPFSVAHVSLVHNAERVASSDGFPGTALLWAAGLTAFWLALGLWRVGRIQMSVSE